MIKTAIPLDKIDAYKATKYRVGAGNEAFDLAIGKHSISLQSLYDACGENCGVFITAFNPFGHMQIEGDNEAAHVRLGKQLRALSPLVIEGAGIDPAGVWPAETSYFAIGIDEENSRLLGCQYNQDAVVWVGTNAVPELLLLR